MSTGSQRHGLRHCAILCVVQAEAEGEEEAVAHFSLGLAAVIPCTIICGEWPPSGVANVTCPDREKSNLQLSSGVG